MSIASPFLVYYIVPYALCMVYLPTRLGDFVRANVGKHVPAPWFAYGCSFLLWYWHQSSSKIPRTIPWDPKKCQQIPILCLVGGIPTPLKNMSSSVGMMNFPWKVIQNSMVPVTTIQLQTSHLCFAWIFEVPSYIYIYVYVCMYYIYVIYVYIYISTTLSPGPSESTTAGLAAIERSTSPGIPGSPRATFRFEKFGDGFCRQKWGWVDGD